MPFLDRYWWLRLFLGGVLLIATLLFTLWYLFAAAPVDLRFGQFGVSDAILATENTLILGYAAFVSLWRAQQSRMRRARRLDAMAGNRDAVSLARPVTETAEPDASNAPPWQYSFPTSSIVLTVLGGAFFLFAYGFFLTLLFKNLQLLLSLDGPLTLFNAKSQTPAPGLVAIIPFVTILLAPVALAQDSVTGAGDQRLGRCASLFVNEEGIQWRTRSGREHSMRWSDVHLYEVMHQSVRAQQYGPQITWRISILYTNDNAFWWQERASDDASIRSPRFADLARYIEVKTLLQPRTFDPLLMNAAQPAQKKAARLGRSALLFVAIYLPTIVLVAAQGVQGTILISAVFAGLLAFLLILDARTSKPPNFDVVAVGEEADSADDEPDEADYVFEMRVSAPWFELARVLGIVVAGSFSLLLAAALIYGVLELVSDGMRRVADPSALIWPSAIFGGLAVFATIRLISMRATIVRADATGLIQDGPVRFSFIPWNGIISIERHDVTTAGFYKVEGDVGYVVKWPLQAPKSLRYAPSRDAALVEPRQLAEIVMARSGVPVTTRVHGKQTQHKAEHRDRDGQFLHCDE